MNDGELIDRNRTAKERRSKKVVIFGWSESVHIKRWAAGMQASGFKVRVISLGGEPLDGVETINLPRKSALSYLFYIPVAIRAARDFSPDLIHVHYAGAFGLWSYFCRFAPLLVSVWGADVVELKRFSLRRIFVKLILRRADYISATSFFLRKTVTELTPKLMNEPIVIPFGVEVPAQCNYPPSPPIKLCFIKIHRRKYGPDILLKAMQKVILKNSKITLTMAGSGPMTAELRDLSKSLELEKNVTFIGQIDNDEIYDLLKKHHIMVMPSLTEAFGVAVLEAAACARPTIASRVGGVPEVVEDGVTGLLVPPGDVDALAEAILTLASNSEKCRRMGQAGYEMVKDRYSWNKSLEMMTELYNRMIDGK